MTMPYKESFAFHWGVAKLLKLCFLLTPICKPCFENLLPSFGIHLQLHSHAVYISDTETEIQQCNKNLKQAGKSHTKKIIILHILSLYFIHTQCIFEILAMNLKNSNFSILYYLAIFKKNSQQF